MRISLLVKHEFDSHLQSLLLTCPELMTAYKILTSVFNYDNYGGFNFSIKGLLA